MLDRHRHRGARRAHRAVGRSQMNWTIGKKLYGAFGALTVMLAVSSYVGYARIEQLSETLDEVGQRAAVNAQRAEGAGLHLAFLRLSAGDAVVGAARGNHAQVEKAHEAAREHQQEAAAALKLVVESTTVDAVKRRGVDAITNLGELAAGYDPLWTMAAKNEAAGASEVLAKYGPMGNKLQEDVDGIVDLLKTRQEDLLEDAHALERKSHFEVISIIIFSVVVCAFVLYVVRAMTRDLRNIATELEDGASQVASAATLVSASAQSLSQGSTEQAASLQETSASMEEMASMTRSNAEHSHEASKLMAEANQLVDGSNRSLGEMVQSMTSIRESSDKVSKIIKTIDEIAFQTNILALNAAVEAARAGEAGMGFAVVADEVRSLAQRSARAAKDTASLIEESIANAHAGNRKVEEVASSITALTSSVSKVKRIVDQVSEASRQQSQGIDQVTQAVTQMEKVTQSTAANAEESAAASEELNAQADTSLAIVERLERMVLGQSMSAAIVGRTTSAVSGAARTKKLVRFGRARGAARPAAEQSPEEAIPLENTGTYGNF
jgi:methyl-accepting chemotaxis protein